MSVASTAPRRRPDVEQAYNHLASLFTPTSPSDDWLVLLRRAMKRFGDVGPKPSLEGVRVTPVSAGGVPAEWVVADAGSPRHRIVYIHGGGWSAGAPEDYRGFAAELARRSGASVLVVDYRQAPENPFPAGLDDCSTALAWAAVHGPDSAQNEDPTSAAALSLVLAGDSSGGNLAAAACLQAVTQDARVPDRLVLIAGVLDGVSNPDRVGLDDPIVTAESIAGSCAQYIAGRVELTDPRVSPVYAADDVLARFPPTLLQVSTTEFLLSDAKRFARRLEEAGIRVNLSIWPGLPHVWHVFLGLFPEAPQAIQEIADFVRV